MTVTTLDTHETVKELLAAGFTDDQAEAVTRLVRRAQDIDLSNLATKDDLRSGLAATKSDLELALVATKSDLQLSLAAIKTDIADAKTETLKWMVGAIGMQTVVILGTVVALAKTVLH